jgi:molecular chaperone DnaK (HSP70)
MAFGIDLGTTNSCVAHIDDAGRAAIVKSALGEDTTPSAVYFESARHAIVGRAARNAALIDPDLVAQQVKRDMGKGVEYTFHGKPHTPEMVSAIILRELARGVEENTGELVRDVVITIPASFGVAEQEATRRAGQLADLNVLDLLAEPVAAALHYQAVLGTGAGVRHILVYDLGGGTFDTTVIRVDGDAIAVVCSDGDARLGGADWDAVIVDHLLGEFAAEHPGLRPREDASFMQDLAIEAERLKEGLSSVESRRHVMRFGGAVCPVNVTRTELEKLTESLLTRTIAVTERTIATARARGVTGFDDVLLVGGMTKMPAVTRALKDRLGLTARLHQPDVAVAKGAALRALALSVRPAASGPARGGLSGAASPGLRPEDVAATTGLTVSEVEELARKRVTTVVSRGFGVKTLDARDPLALTDPVSARKMIVHLLSANTPLPEDTGPFTFHTTLDNQRMVMVEVWEQTSEQESADLADNRKIGEGLLKIPHKMPVHTPIDVTFYMSETGRLTVRAVEPGSGMNLEFHLQIGDIDPAKMDQARRSVADYDVSGD